MLGATQFMVDFRLIHFKAKKALYINFQNHASIFHKAMISTINVGEHGRFYILTTIMRATTNNDFPMEVIYSGLVCQHALANILNVSQRFVKLLHLPTKPHGNVGQFPNRQKGNK